ncbi:glycosyltransferase, partial [Aestuariivirga litoralis]|uniref:glycosyltransferase n=1 Tax=Aestuariivirga litoralis TaxID=2650924 RepID=UPI0018C720B3
MPTETLEGIIPQLSGAQIARMLRDRLVPLADGSFADAAPWMRRITSDPRRRIAAQVSADQFHNAVFHQLGKKLMQVSVNRLRRQAPIFSAQARVPRMQAFLILLGVAAVVAPFIFAPLQTALNGLCEFFSLVFFATLWIRFLALVTKKKRTRAAPQLHDGLLPVYTVLVPLYREAGMLAQLVRAMNELDYPHEKLDVKLLLEEGDLPTLTAVQRMVLPPFIEVLIAPKGKPQTKPRALNYGLQFARGALLTIFDAEDIPDPMQLRRAASAFAELPERVACLQAELAFHNADENWLAR